MIKKQLAEQVLGIDHVAIAVEDIDSSIEWYTSTLNFAVIKRSEVFGEHSGMLYAVIKSGDATVVLVQGTSPESQVSKFLTAFGSGIHHIAFAVSDLDKAINKINASGIVTNTPVIGDEGIRQVFLQRDSTTGVRVELIERQNVPFSEQNVEQLFRALEEKDLY